MQQSSISRFAMLGIVVAVASLGGVYLSGLEDRKLNAARTTIEIAVKSGQDGPIFAVIENKFPADYAEFFDNAAALSAGGSFDGPAGERKLTEFRQGFLTQLRQKYANFLRVASPDAARAIQQSTLDVLLSLSGQPGLCARYAAFGGNGLTIEEAETMDVTPIINASALVYEMIAEGRDRPVENTVALPEDKDTLIALWIAQTKPSEGFQAAVSTNNWQHPDYCAASISLQEIIISDRSDATLRFLVDTTATALAQ